MNLGIPKKAKKEVKVGGKEDTEIRSKHEVFWNLGNIDKGKESTLIYCDEVPSPEVCNQCIYRFLSCKFSKAERL